MVIGIVVDNFRRAAFAAPGCCLGTPMAASSPANRTLRLARRRLRHVLTRTLGLCAPFWVGASASDQAQSSLRRLAASRPGEDRRRGRGGFGLGRDARNTAPLPARRCRPRTSSATRRRPSASCTKSNAPDTSSGRSTTRGDRTDQRRHDPCPAAGALDTVAAKMIRSWFCRLTGSSIVRPQLVAAAMAPRSSGSISRTPPPPIRPEHAQEMRHG